MGPALPPRPSFPCPSAWSLGQEGIKGEKVAAGPRRRCPAGCCPGGTPDSPWLFPVEAPDQGLAHAGHADHAVAEALQLVQDHARGVVHVVLTAAPGKDGNKVSWGRKGREFPGGSWPASLLTPVGPAATPGTGVRDAGPRLTPGEGTAHGAKPRESCPGEKDRVEWECGSGAGVQSHVLLRNWADAAAQGSQVNAGQHVFNVPGNSWRRGGMIQVFLRNEIPTFCLCQSASARWVGLRVCWNLGIGRRCRFQPGGKPLESQ